MQLKRLWTFDTTSTLQPEDYYYTQSGVRLLPSIAFAVAMPVSLPILHDYLSGYWMSS